MKSTFYPNPKISAIILLAWCFALTPNNALKAQVQFNWALSQGSNESDYILGCLADDQGHLYTLLAITDTTDLDPGPGTVMFAPWYEEAPVFTKWSDDGTYLWSAAFQTKGETGANMFKAINNQLYFSLYYTDTLFYVHPSGTTTLSTTPGEHVALVIMDLDGHILSLKEIQPSFNFYFINFQITGPDEYLIGGGFSDSIQFHNGDTETTFYARDYDAFIASFDLNFNLKWLQQFSSVDEDYCSSLYVSNDKIYYAIGHADTLTIPTINGMVTFPATTEDAIFGTMSLDGQILTAQPLSGDIDDDIIEDIEADAAGNIYVCGYFSGTVNFEHPDAPPVYFTSTSIDGFASKYSPEGRLQWTRIVHNSDYGGIYYLDVKRNQYLYLSGGYTGHADLDPGPDSMIMETTNWDDIYGMKLDLDGNLQWVYPFIGPDLEGITNQIISPDARIYYYGFAYNVFDGDPGPDEFLIPNRGGTDQFLISLTEENVITSNTEPDPFQIQLFPNPATDRVYLHTQTPMESIVVYAADGKMVNVNTDFENLSACLRTSSLQSGWYTVRVKTSNAYQTLKFLKS